MKYTKGPWTYRKNTQQPDNDGLIHISFKPGLYDIFSQGKTTDRVYWSVVEMCENENDAHLIAAAPEMYEALKTAQVRIFMLEGNSEEYEKIDALLNKIEGR